MNSLQDILPHVGADSLDNCMAEVLPNLIPCLGSARVSVRKAAIQVKVQKANFCDLLSKAEL